MPSVASGQLVTGTVFVEVIGDEIKLPNKVSVTKRHFGSSQVALRYLGKFWPKHLGSSHVERHFSI